MVEIIPENKREMYSREEIHEKFRGKWLYLVNAEFTKSHKLVKARVAIVADMKYERWKEGIYLELDKKSNDTLAECDLRDLPHNIISVYEGK